MYHSGFAMKKVESKKEVLEDAFHEICRQCFSGRDLF